MENIEKQTLEYVSLHDYAQNSFIYNDYCERKKVSTDIIENLLTCDEFYFSVAFITSGGLEPLKQALEMADARGVKGKILTTNYLTFTQPQALKDLTKLKNIEVKMFYLNSDSKVGFHTKGYIFKKGDTYTTIVGSSNITGAALSQNKEWNSLFRGKKDNKAISDILNEFENMFKKADPLSEVLEKYENEYKTQIVIRKEKEKTTVSIFEPNSMQKNFINSLNNYINNGAKRGLLVSATGTGKTFASAFGIKYLKAFEPNKVLFIAHRDKILRQSKDTYEKVFDKENKTFGFLIGSEKDIKDKNFIFASFATIYKKENLELFKTDEFDFIIIDEVHKVGENHYQDIINYFTPKFLLGMSATPDRTDGYDLYKPFHNNIIFEINLMHALDLDLLTPFNYFGISDLIVDGKLIDDVSDFNLLTSDERIKHILKESDYYGFSGDKLRALVFAPTIEIGKEITRKLVEQGKRAVFVCGSDSKDTRDKYIKRLEAKESPDSIDFLVSVDILNEGVDIPSVNQVILLRPTKSSIIFLQQIGRGLRKFINKEFVVILDFIGNYKGNFNIVKAFNKGRWTKSNAAKTVSEILPALSSISFDEVAKESIFRSIDTANINGKKEIYLTYLDVKQRLNHIPNLIELYEHSNLSINVFLSEQIFFSYYEFLITKDEDFKKGPKLNKVEENLLSYFSKYVFDGKRKCDLDLVNSFINNGSYKLSNAEINNKNFLVTLKEFIEMHTVSIKNKLSFAGFSADNKEILINNDFKNALNNDLFVSFMKDGLNYGYKINKEVYNSSNDLVLNHKYTRNEIARIVNLPRNNISTMNGYQIYEKQGIIPVFINYEKQKDDIKYQDKFLSESLLTWSSRPATIDSPSIKKIIDLVSSKKCKLSIFVQRSNIRQDGYYYLGEAKILSFTNFFNEDTKKTVVHFELKLDTPVRKDIYDYLTLNNGL